MKRRSVRSKRTQRKSLRKQKKTNVRRNVRSKRVKNVRKMKRSKKSTQKGGGNDCKQKLIKCEKKNTELKKLNNKLTKDYLSKHEDLYESVRDIKTMYTNLSRDRQQIFDPIMDDWKSRVPRKRNKYNSKLLI